MKPVIALGPPKYMPNCNCCGERESAGAKALELGWQDEPKSGSAHVTTMCEACRRLLLITLLEELPAFPCGFAEADVVEGEMFKGAVVHILEHFVADPEEAQGIAVDILRAAFEAEKR